MKATLAFVLFLITVFIIEDVKNFYGSTHASFFETDMKSNSLIPGTILIFFEYQNKRNSA